MKTLVGLIAAILLTLSAGAALAHGDQPHGSEPTSMAAEIETSSTSRDVSAGAAQSDAAADHDSHQTDGGGIVGALKNLHPATVHFPIALFLMAGLTEIFVIARRTPGREAAVRTMLYGGAAGGVIAVLFGWIHTGLWFGGETAMQVHRWNGMLIAAGGLVLALIARARPASRTLLRLMLFPLALLLILQGFLGGELAHGAGHLGL